MLQWKLSSFSNLSVEELYTIMRLRQEVFVVEQNCPYLDADGKDQASFHLTGTLDNKLIAYARILPPGYLYLEASIGRIVTSPKYRRTGYGKQLMQQSIDETKKMFGNLAIRIMAQQYLERFYASYGFVTFDEPFLEDNIWHINMLRQPEKN